MRKVLTAFVARTGTNGQKGEPGEDGDDGNKGEPGDDAANPLFTFMGEVPTYDDLPPAGPGTEGQTYRVANEDSYYASTGQGDYIHMPEVSSLKGEKGESIVGPEGPMKVRKVQRVLMATMAPVHTRSLRTKVSLVVSLLGWSHSRVKQATR